MSKGWISIHRKLQNHWLWEDKPFSKGQAWIDLLMLANHEDAKFLLGNQLTEANRGDVVTSEVKLMARWGWSNTKVRAFLNLLEKDSMIIKKTDSKKSVLTLTGYSVWQDTKSEKEVEQKCIKSALKVDQHTINNTNNKNNTNNSNKSISLSQKNKFSDDAIELSLASELFNLISENNPKTKKPNLQTWAKPFDLMIRVDHRIVEDIRVVMNWCQHDQFWQGNILSPGKLREKYDQLTMRMKSKPSKGTAISPGKTDPTKFNKFYL